MTFFAVVLVLDLVSAPLAASCTFTSSAAVCAARLHSYLRPSGEVSGLAVSFSTTAREASVRRLCRTSVSSPARFHFPSISSSLQSTCCPSASVAVSFAIALRLTLSFVVEAAGDSFLLFFWRIPLVELSLSSDLEPVPSWLLSL